VRPGERPVALQDLVQPKPDVKVEKTTAPATAATTSSAPTATRPTASTARTLPPHMQIKQEKAPPEKRMKFLTWHSLNCCMEAHISSCNVGGVRDTHQLDVQRHFTDGPMSSWIPNISFSLKCLRRVIPLPPPPQKKKKKKRLSWTRNVSVFLLLKATL